MSELAVVSARHARLRVLAEDNHAPHQKGARTALKLAEDPSSFLSLVQIGMTMTSVLMGAFGGQTFAGPLADYLSQFAPLAPVAGPVALVTTVVGLSYFNLVIGELVPKRIGLAYAEAIAVRIAGIVYFLEKVTAPVVCILRFSTNLCVKLSGLSPRDTATVTEDEVKDLIAEGTEHGVFKPAEKKMLEGVMRLADRNVRTIMTPRIDVVWLSDEDTLDEKIETIRESGYSRFPVATGDMEQVVGILHAKDLLNAVLQDKTPNIEACMRAPLFVPDTTPVLRLVDQFRQSSQHVAIVVDEYGSVEGLVSVTDILEAITGDLPELGQEADERPVQREDGSWLLDGMMPIDEVENLLGLKNMQGGGDYHTIAGFMIDKLGRIPMAGDYFIWNDIRFEVVDMDARRVDKVLIHMPLPEDQEASHGNG